MKYIIILLPLIFSLIACQGFKRLPANLTYADPNLDDVLKITDYCKNLIKDTDEDEANFRDFDGRRAIYNLMTQQELIEPGIKDNNFTNKCPNIKKLYDELSSLLSDDFRMSDYIVKLVNKGEDIHLNFSISLEREINKGVTELRKFSIGAVSCPISKEAKKKITEKPIATCL